MGLNISVDVDPVEADFDEFIGQLGVDILLEEMFDYDDGNLRGEMFEWFKSRLGQKMNNEEKILSKKYDRLAEGFDAAKVIDAMCKVIAAVRVFQSASLISDDDVYKAGQNIEQALKEFDELKI